METASGASLANLSPDQARVRVSRSSPTVGALIEAAERVAVHVKPMTLRGYGVCLRWLAAHVAGVAGDASRFDLKAGGSARQVCGSEKPTAWSGRTLTSTVASCRPLRIEHRPSAMKVGSASPKSGMAARRRCVSPPTALRCLPGQLQMQARTAATPGPMNTRSRRRARTDPTGGRRIRGWVNPANRARPSRIPQAVFPPKREYPTEICPGGLLHGSFAHSARLAGFTSRWNISASCA